MCTSSHVQPVVLVLEANKIVEVFSPLEKAMFCHSPAHRTVRKAVHSQGNPNCELWCVKIPPKNEIMTFLSIFLFNKDYFILLFWIKTETNG